jgi:hypothetical protein
MTEYPSLNLSHVERRRIIRDHASWYAEGPDRTTRGIREHVRSLSKLNDDDLIRAWYDDVGEWVLSRRDVLLPRTLDEDTFLDSQLGRLLSGQETDYGFLNVISVSSVLDSTTPTNQQSETTANTPV